MNAIPSHCYSRSMKPGPTLTAMMSFWTLSPKRMPASKRLATMSVSHSSRFISTVRRCRAKAGVKNIRLHDHRHDRATKLLRETHNLKLVQLALNHAKISTTTKFAHVMDEDLAAALEKSAESRNSSRRVPADIF